MSKPLDISFTEQDLAGQIGHLMIRLWAQQKQLSVLEKRVDELDPPSEGEDA